MIKKIISIALALALLLSLPSCGSSDSRFTVTYFEYFDTVTELIGYTGSRQRFDEVSGELRELLETCHRQFDIYNEYEDITNLATVNRSKGQPNRKFSIDKELFDLLSLGKEAYSLTEGSLNIAMGGVLSLWHECRTAEQPHLPNPMSLLLASSHTNPNLFSIYELDGEYLLTVIDPELTFDVGALAKGYAARLALELLGELCLPEESFLLNLGGMVCPVGARPDGKGWTVGIEYPTASLAREGYLRTVSLSGGALVTSASHYRAFTVNGKSYGHIIDPTTNYPAEYFASVTVYCDDPAIGDALSTAFFCMSEIDGRRIVEDLSDLFGEIEVLWVYPDMRVSTTNGFPKAD